MNFGAQSEYRKLEVLLLHRPEAHDLGWIQEHTLAYYNFAAKVEPDKFLAEYDGMVEAFAGQGVEIIFLTDVLKNNKEALSYISRRPNLTYMRDMATVYDAGAVVMYPQLKGRQWDNWVITECFRALGIPVLGEISYPGYLEGGGCGFLNNRTGYVSLCDRANEEAIGQLASFTLNKTLDSLIVVNLPQGHVHIDGLFFVADKRTAFVHREVLEVSPARVMHSDGTVEHVWFCDYLEKLGFDLIDGPMGVDMNYVALRPGHLIGYARARANLEAIRSRGWQVTGIRGDELAKGNGGVHCMTCPILRCAD